MGQVTIYLDDDTEQMMVASAAQMRVSKSKWVAGIIREKLSVSWPPTVVEAVGSWKEFPSAEELRKDLAADAAREAFD